MKRTLPSLTLAMLLGGVAASKYGADGARITTKGWGAGQPVEDNATEDGRALNRRVEIVLAR